MDLVNSLYRSIVADLEKMGAESAYSADANEPDPRYKSYGVRAPQTKALIKTHRPAVRALTDDQKRTLATQLIQSEYGEQQTVALAILEPLAAWYTPNRFPELDSLIRHLRGWSKVDSYTGTLLRDILFAHPEPMLDLVQTWNDDPDMWLRRTSVVLFTRKVARSGRFIENGLRFGNNLLTAPEDLVQKGVGWMLKDMMKADKPRILKYVRHLRAQGVPSTITLYAIRDLNGAERAAVLAI